jgi:uncharacterized membrane protein
LKIRAFIAVVVGCILIVLALVLFLIIFVSGHIQDRTNFVTIGLTVLVGAAFVASGLKGESLRDVLKKVFDEMLKFP